MQPETRLTEWLIEQGFGVASFSREETLARAADWAAVFGRAWAANCRMRAGSRAMNEYEQQVARGFHIVPLPRHLGGPPEASTRGPFWHGIACSGEGPLPDLSEFAQLELTMWPADLEWTLVHTHEDYSLGGPYFIRREWVVTGKGEPV